MLNSILMAQELFPDWRQLNCITRGHAYKSQLFKSYLTFLYVARRPHCGPICSHITCAEIGPSQERLVNPSVE